MKTTERYTGIGGKERAIGETLMTINPKLVKHKNGRWYSATAVYTDMLPKSDSGTIQFLRDKLTPLQGVMAHVANVQAERELIHIQKTPPELDKSRTKFSRTVKPKTKAAKRRKRERSVCEALEGRLIYIIPYLMSIPPQ